MTVFEIRALWVIFAPEKSKYQEGECRLDTADLNKFYSTTNIIAILKQRKLPYFWLNDNDNSPDHTAVNTAKVQYSFSVYRLCRISPKCRTGISWAAAENIPPVKRHPADCNPLTCYTSNVPLSVIINSDTAPYNCLSICCTDNS
jgi:hypothetical protein